MAENQSEHHQLHGSSRMSRFKECTYHHTRLSCGLDSGFAQDDVWGSGVMSGTKILRFKTIKNLILLDSSMAQLVS